MTTFLFYPSASGLALFERVEGEEIGSKQDKYQEAILDLQTFSKIVKLKAFLPFTSAENALENMNHISEGEITPFVKDFLELNLPKTKPGKSSKFSLAVEDAKVGNVVQETTGVKCVANDAVFELFRGVRMHFTRFIKALKDEDLAQAQLGLGHSYSRAKVKFNVNKVDNMIIQSIALVDQLDKDLNTFAMRVREWYSWHFPELVQIVNDNYTFCRLALLIKNKSELSEDSLASLEEVTMDKTKAQEIIDAAKMSMGTDTSDIDMINIHHFAERVIKLSEYRKQLYEYLVKKMNTCAPNLSALIGEQVGARLISHAGSLTNLAKYPASTVQILGAEKALFRALKTKGNTPKYGLIFHSSFIGRAQPKNKGRISRYLANKCSIASRIDAFSDVPTAKFGEKLKEQCEERLEFYKTGTAPKKNAVAMKQVIDDLGSDLTAAIVDETAAVADGEKKKKKKRKSEAPVAMEETPAEPQPEPEPAKQKKSKKSKKADE